MALVKCPECGNMVSTKAAFCPSCGCPAKFINLMENKGSISIKDDQAEPIIESKEQDLLKRDEIKDGLTTIQKTNEQNKPTEENQNVIFNDETVETHHKMASNIDVELIGDEGTSNQAEIDMVFCMECGTQIPRSERYCHNCQSFNLLFQESTDSNTQNNAIEAPVNERGLSSENNKLVFCMQCGSGLLTTERFCRKCGTKNARYSGAEGGNKE